MKHVFIFLLIIHGLIHLMGFLREWKLAPVHPLSGITAITVTKNAALVVGLCWLATCILFMFAAILFYLSKDWWWIPAMLAIVTSQILIILYWKDAKWGTVANIIILTGVVIACAQWNFNTMVKSETHLLQASMPKEDRTVVNKEMLSGLPAPVQNWLMNSGVIGKQKIQSVRLKQVGSMRSKPEQKRWSAMHAEQYFRIDEPSFIWQAKMNLMPMITVDARDKYVNGKGEMKIMVLSLIPIANSIGYQVDQGSLQRYLAEICWFPTAALNRYIKWQAIDSLSARATLTYKGSSGSAIFHFSEKGDILACNADRYMSTGNGASLEKWEVRSTEYGVMNGIRIPVKSEATWKLKTGDFTWLKLEITQIEYNQQGLY
jgi:hypothetical protein